MGDVRGAMTGGPHFVDEAQERGVVYIVAAYEFSSAVVFFGYGSAIADLNGNGHQDILVLGAADGTVGIFENDGAGYFTDRSETSGIPKLARASGVAIADYNGDGMLDIYITQDRIHPQTVFSEPNVLLRNEGDFTFSERGAEAGVGNVGRGQGAAWGDLERDGWLDLYLTNWTHAGTPPNHFNQFYKNLANETFSEIGAELGVNNHGNGFVAVWTDINRDGWLDLYLVNDRGTSTTSTPNQLWRNDGGTLTNISESSGANIALAGMGAACADITGNGYPDFYISNIPSEPLYGGKNPLLANQADETFIDFCEEAEVDHYKFSWATIFFDYDNDSHLDLYVANLYEPNTLYTHAGGFPFVDITEKAGIGGPASRGFSAAVGDVTGNGALDILVNDQDVFGGPGLPVRLYINTEGTKRNWIRFKMIGRPPNTAAIGGFIELLAGGTTYWQEIYAGGNNYKSQNELIFHFGLGDLDAVESIHAVWPGGSPSRTLTGYAANTLWTIYPPEQLGDANGDGVINVFDLLALLAGWGDVKPGTERMEMNGDGVINVFDLLQLLSNWGG